MNKCMGESFVMPLASTMGMWWTAYQQSKHTHTYNKLDLLHFSNLAWVQNFELFSHILGDFFYSGQFLRFDLHIPQIYSVIKWPGEQCRNDCWLGRSKDIIRLLVCGVEFKQHDIGQPRLFVLLAFGEYLSAMGFSANRFTALSRIVVSKAVPFNTIPVNFCMTHLGKCQMSSKCIRLPFGDFWLKHAFYKTFVSVCVCVNFASDRMSLQSHPFHLRLTSSSARLTRKSQHMKTNLYRDAGKLCE